jgi:ketosteroid isomerase-like protein
MSQENVEVYRRAVAAWNAGDLDAFLNSVSPDWEFRTTETFPDFKPVYRGPAGANEFWETLREPWEEFHIEIVGLRSVGERVVGLLKFYGRGRKSGVKTTLEVAHIATVVNGRIAGVRGFLSHREAFEAAGLSE